MESGDCFSVVHRHLDQVVLWREFCWTNKLVETETAEQWFRFKLYTNMQNISTGAKHQDFNISILKHVETFIFATVIEKNLVIEIYSP